MSGAGLARRGVGAVHGHRTLEADLGVGGVSRRSGCALRRRTSWDR